jgi:hypothetical protein
VVVVARDALHAAVALLDYSNSRGLTVLTAMTARGAVEAVHGPAVSMSVRQPES